MEYEELLERLAKATTPKELRAIHKELRKFGDGIPFHSRYPDFAYYLSWIAFGVGILGLIMRVLIG